MKFKKATTFTVVAAVCLIIGTTAAFATSAQSHNSDVIHQTDNINESSDDNKTLDDMSDGNDTPALSATSAATDEKDDEAANSNDINSAYDEESKTVYIGWENMPDGPCYMRMIDGVPHFYQIESVFTPVEESNYTHEEIRDGVIIRW